MEYDAREQYYIWLASVEGLSAVRFYRLLERFEDARTVWNNVGAAAAMLPSKVALSLLKARSEHYFYALFNRIEHMKCHVITRISDYYPSLLTKIYDPPPLLYVLGDLELFQEKQIAVVGSRRASRDGKRAALEISKGLAGQGVTIVSGLARGVDACAHQGAVEGGGKTIAVLGSGVDVIYPPENKELARKILKSGGCIISEYPPGTPPYSYHFPARNRIISGLSTGVLLVEGAKNSGAMITVDQALEQGRDVCAVPGSIYSPLSQGPNQLIFDGAMPVRSHWDILERFGWGQRPSGAAPERSMPKDLEPDEEKLVEMLKIEDKSFDELSNLTGFDSAKLNSLLTILELRGIIKQMPGRIYRA